VVIKQTSFKHGWYYFYRVHEPKLQALTEGYPALAKYLYTMFDHCPHDYFEVEPRSSKLRFSLEDLELTHIDRHELTELTKLGLRINAERYKSDHSKVQLFMLENDAQTVAIEVPLWLHHEELNGYEALFSSKNPLTGHIDALRIEDGKIWIWDYKPNARLEKYASTQVYFYAYMLSQRTGIPLEHFRCGYFDSVNTYVFDPNTVTVPRSVQGVLVARRQAKDF